MTDHNNTWLTDVTDKLRAEADQLKQRLHTIRSEAKQVDDNLKRLTAALSALEGKPTAKKKKKPANGKPAATCARAK